MAIKYNFYQIKIDEIYVKIPAIAKLEVSEILNLISEVKQGVLPEDHKAVVAEILEFYKKLVEDLKQSKINIHQLKQMLGFHSEQLKKEMLKK